MAEAPPKPHRPTPVTILIAVEFFGAIGGFIGGVPFILEPSGGLLGVNVAMFPGLPFRDFFLIGLWLFAIFGVGSCLVAVLLARRHRLSVPLAALESAIWLVFVGYEVVLWGPSGFIVPWLVPPVVVFALLGLPAVRRYARSGAAQGSS